MIKRCRRRFAADDSALLRPLSQGGLVAAAAATLKLPVDERVVSEALALEHDPVVIGPYAAGGAVKQQTAALIAAAKNVVKRAEATAKNVLAPTALQEQRRKMNTDSTEQHS